MSTKRRKPPVVEINGNGHKPDIITDDDLRAVADLQAFAWRAERGAQHAVIELERRILHGAKVEGREWYWDADLRMVRSRKEKRA